MKNRPPFVQALTFDDVLLVPQESHISTTRSKS